MSFEQLVAAVQRYHPSPDIKLLQDAYEYAFQQHRGQVRASGEPYFTHLFETALLATELKLDVPSIAAALLHDSIEDCLIVREDIEKRFGGDIADIVEGVTKLTRIEFQSREEKQAENFRKMLLAMAKDIRVIFVKLCDRLHNMRTLTFLTEEKRRVIAEETRDIYAPLANRLGIHWLKSELEDLCLFHLRPEIYNLIRENFDRTAAERDTIITKTCFEISKVLEESGVSGAVKGRAKHYFSIWQKMEKDNLSFDQVHDLLGFRVIVPTVRACYETLGIIHAHYKPVPNRVKDYIAMPKPNMYQSLHTTVIGLEGLRLEVQIRTPEMNMIAEEGVAAHWRYKESDKPSPASMDLQWMRDLVETQQYLKNPDEFIQSVKGELFPEEVFVFTPKGTLIRLPYNATPIDFAYAVHTDVGHRATGAKVNNLIEPLDYRLQNGDIVEILTAKNHVPSKDWLKFVQSSKAKQRIRAFLKSEEHARALAVGADILSKDLRKVKLSLKKMETSGKIETLAHEMGLRGEGDLYAEVGYGKISTAKLIAKLLPEGTQIEESLQKKASPLQRIFQRAAKVSRLKVGVTVSGFDDILVRFAKCCEPLPGDRILGFITRGRGITVHYAECPHALEMDPQRMVEVRWDDEVRPDRKVKLVVYSQDQLGILANMCKGITDNGANIVSAHARTNDKGKAENTFEITVADAKHYDRVKRSLEMVPGVIKVVRLSISSSPADEESQ